MLPLNLMEPLFPRNWFTRSARLSASKVKEMALPEAVPEKEAPDDPLAAPKGE